MTPRELQSIFPRELMDMGQMGSSSGSVMENHMEKNKERQMETVVSRVGGLGVRI